MIIKATGVLIGTFGVISVLILITLWHLFKRQSISKSMPDVLQIDNVSKDLVIEEPDCKEIPLKEIYAATNNLNFSNFIGQGIAGKVYKGVLSNGWHVAIKHIIKDGHAETFVREITSLSHVRHPNLVTLRGYCEGEDNCFLVYELCPNGSLSEWLFGKEKTLSWTQRLEIAIGSARGLWFLHTYSGGCIVHRDVKPANILLGDDFEAKLSDFGLSKVMEVGVSNVSSEVRGTFGYVDKSAPFLFFLIALSIALSAAAHGGGSGEDADSDSDSDSGTGSGSPNLRSKSLIMVKVWCLIIVFFGTFLGGVSPYFLKWNEGFLVLGTQFAGGVFLGTAMMHFLSDSNETFGDLTEIEYPFAFMLACAGYVITMLADCVISFLVSRKKSVRDVEGGGKGRIALEKVNSNGRDSGESCSQQEGQHGSHNQSVEYVLSHASSVGDSILLIVALCFHSVFEGIAIGVAENKADAWKALWTICLHKIFAAVAMGIALLRMLPNRPLVSCVAYAFAFAISSPIGVAIGILIDSTTQGHVADWIYAISMGIACGVFIYVAINHLLAKGYQPQRPVVTNTPIYRWLAVVLGIGVIAVVMIWDT